MQIIIILNLFEDFFACKIAFDAYHDYPELIRRLFRLQICLKSKSSLSWKYSKPFSPANLSYPQIIIILKIFKDFSGCKIVLAAKHHYPEKIQRLFRQQNCLTCKSSLSWKFSNTFRLQNCLSRKSRLSWKYSKTYSPAKLSQLKTIIILEIFKDSFACKIVFDANHHYPENIQRLFRLQNCLSRKTSLSWKNSKTFSPAKLSWPQIIIILKLFKDFFACKIVLVAKLRYPENIQRLFRLQNCLRRKSSLSWKYSKTFSPANLSQPQNFVILKIFKDFFAWKSVFDANHDYPENIQRIFACRIILAANHHYHGNIQRLFRLQNCLSRKTSLS